MKKWLLLLFLPVMLMFCTSQQNNNLDNEINIINDFLADPGSFEILNSYQGKRNVLKVDGTKTINYIVKYSLAQYRNRPIAIEISVDLWREEKTAKILWQVNNAPNYPAVAFVDNALPGRWHNVRGRLIITPTNDDPYIYLTNWEINSQDTFYIANPIITVTENGIGTALDLPSLKSIYAEHFLIGNITTHDEIYTSGQYFNAFLHHHNAVTSTVTYPYQLAPPEKGGTYNWVAADRTINLMRRNNIPIHGHVLVYHELTPAWLTEGSRDEVLQNMTDYITTVLRHFRGRITSWEVVNEAINDNITTMSDREQITQALIYARLMNLYKEYSAHISRVTMWGMDDRNSWLSKGNPALFDWKLNAKQAFYAVSDPDSFLAQYGRTQR